MIDRHPVPLQEFGTETPREVKLLSFISQVFIQPFSVQENLLALLTALTSGSGVGFNRAMLFLVEGRLLRGRLWLGPPSPEDAWNIWEVLSTPGMGFVEIVEYNRSLLESKRQALSARVEGLIYDLDGDREVIPSLAARRREILHVREAEHEPLVDQAFKDVIGVREFLCIPLLSREDVLGEIVVDNAFTAAPITAADIRLAGLCGLIAGNYLYTALLAQKMVDMEKMAAMGEMGVFLVHQLRNPLTVIGGFTDQLLNDRLSEKKRTRNLAIIRKEIRRLEAIIGRISRLTRIEARSVVPLELPRLLEEILSAPGLRAKGRGRDIRVVCPPDLPNILGLPLDTPEALRNILDNALEAAPRGGEVVVRCAPRPNGWVEVSVRDNGPGIPPEIRDKMFAPFVTTKKEGMGLGLVFVKRVMDLCGGRIEVESREGLGTDVRLMFKADEVSP